MIALLLTATVFIIIGIWYLSTPLDSLWRRRERWLLSRGLSPERNVFWDRQMRQTGWLFLGAGVAFFLFCGTITFLSGNQKTGVKVNGHELTRSEWDACGHDMFTCMTRYPVNRNTK